MSAVYGNWERLVGATLRREQLRRIAQRSFSDLSLESSPSFNSSASSRRLCSSDFPNLLVGEGFDHDQILGGANYLKIFTFAELKSATRNFKPDRVLDGGGFGWVFKGWIDENTYAPSRLGVGIAVTVKLFDPESEQDLKAWQAEIQFLGKFCHPNIVKLLGYCMEDNKFFLVYEYMNKGSLENHLFRRWPETLSWEIRMKIAIGAARALAFLHTTEGQVIHRDIKAANILLDGDYNAKLSNFSLAKLGLINGSSFVTTQFAGTFGYAAPEYIGTGKLYLNSNVYSFGVVLLEIVSGRRILDLKWRVLDLKRPIGEQNLVDWATPLLSDRRRFRRIMDPRLEGQYPSRDLFKLADLILKCLVPYPEIRPSMKQVLETLEKIGPLKMKPNDSNSNHRRAYLKFQLPPLHLKYPSGPADLVEPLTTLEHSNSCLRASNIHKKLSQI